MIRLGAIASIDASALVHNLSRVRRLAPKSKVIAVIKADGYGHGLLNVAQALQGADAFAVARMSEAERLRAAGYEHRIILLPGVHNAKELALASTLALDITVHHMHQVQLLEEAPSGTSINAWLKVNSGMHRLGLPPKDVSDVFARLTNCVAVNEKVRIMTHLADADDPNKPTTNNQLRIMRECTNPNTLGTNTELCIGNSAGLLAFEETRECEWVRPGLMLYGISPFEGSCGLDHDLRPAMTLTTRLLAINKNVKGDMIGYGGTYNVDEESMSIGAAAAGYADGYPRHCPNGTSVLIDGIPAPIAGRVSMDTLTIDLSNHPNAQVGSHLTLWGEGLPVEYVATAAGTIGYELVCRVGSRVPRVVISPLQIHVHTNDSQKALSVNEYINTTSKIEKERQM